MGGCATLVVYLMLALGSYNPSDYGWLQTAPSGLHSNMGGIVGAYCADVVFHFFGYTGFFLPVVVFFGGFWFYRSINEKPSKEVEVFHPARLVITLLGLFLVFAAGAGLLTLQAVTPWWCATPVYAGVSSCSAGGVLGVLIGEKIAWTLGYPEASLLLFVLVILGTTFFFGISWTRVAERVGQWSCQLSDLGRQWLLQRATSLKNRVDTPHSHSEENATLHRTTEVRIEPSMGTLKGELDPLDPPSVVVEPATRSTPETPVRTVTLTTEDPSALESTSIEDPPEMPPVAERLATTVSPPKAVLAALMPPPVIGSVVPVLAPTEEAGHPLPPLPPLDEGSTVKNVHDVKDGKGLKTQKDTKDRKQAQDTPSVERLPERLPNTLPPLAPAQNTAPPPTKPVPKATVVSRTPPSSPAPQATRAISSEVEPPALGLLDSSSMKCAPSPERLERLSRQVETNLANFNVEVQVVDVQPGPVVTRFELQPAPGVKVSQITNLSKDVARSLSVISVRVVEVIPGRPTIGLEIPNEKREVVRLGEVLRSPEYERCTHALPLTLGKDIGGKPVVVDLQKMPHLLVAGTTGSGKSVGMNAMVLSLLYKLTPSQVRLIMVDPKMLELSVYQGIPHLLAPVVTDMKEAANALRWCVAEMEQRYRLMASQGVRNIDGFNQKVSDAIADGDPILDPTRSTETESVFTERLPYIVVLIDELADLMMVVGKKVEELIARLAQKARAAGIHLIIATQRPSVDVITGLIKANIPTRIAFQVSSRIDSRTILDQQGAEQLLGHGDMLYLPPGSGVPIRVHGAFVSDQEVVRVAEDLKKRGAPSYIEDVLRSNDPDVEGSGSGEAEATPEDDPLFEEAVRIITGTGRASVSGIQRRLKIGYNRAARLVEEMERCGIVGPLQSNGTREVLKPAPSADASS